MESKILNLPDALKLALMLGKYVKELPNPDSTTVIDFFSPIFENMKPEDFNYCFETVVGKKLSESMTGVEILNSILGGMERNKILSLFMTTKEIGFI